MASAPVYCRSSGAQNQGVICTTFEKRISRQAAGSRHSQFIINRTDCPSRGLLKRLSYSPHVPVQRDETALDGASQDHRADSPQRCSPSDVDCVLLWQSLSVTKDIRAGGRPGMTFTISEIRLLTEDLLVARISAISHDPEDILLGSSSRRSFTNTQ